MGEPYLTWAEIEKAYPNEWVLIADPTHKRRSLAATGGRVVVHAPDRTAFYRLWDEWHDPTVKFLAALYVGTLPAEEDSPTTAEPEVARQ